MADLTAFITRWRASGASERANYQLFLSELCDVIGAPHPDPATDRTAENAYTFERAVTFDEGDGRTSTGFIDLYKRGAFVLEAKQGSDDPDDGEAQALGLAVRRKTGTARRGTRFWELAMKRAKEQALRYARSLPADEGWPPFLLVVDVGYCIDMYADFARQGKTYVPFPDPKRYRVHLEDLARDDVRETLRQVWSDPMALDPARRSARVTRELAGKLARLAASLEASGHTPETVARFLVRSLFTMFAEDVGLLPERSFTRLLMEYRSELDLLPDALAALWQTMNTGGFAPGLRARLVQFNGSLFKQAEVLPLSEVQVDLMIEASKADWKDVEPAIFGTLLERALDPVERHKLGAHYTPRAYVERLVMPAIIEPLREEWTAAMAAATAREVQGDAVGARAEVEQFHRRLCSVRVLDPACGSGNFLYVTLEHLKRLEGEVLKLLEGYGGQQRLDMTHGFTVSPAQLLGLEVNPRAAAIADVVLWIGYLQWHLRTHGSAQRLDPPILREYRNIRYQDALLEQVNGEVRPAPWPQADFIVGNPPFIGKGERMRAALGDTYIEALRRTYAGQVPDSADLVMYWWHRAAERVRMGEAERFGFITTNSLKQTFNRRVVAQHLEAEDKPLSLAYAIPDHPWVDSADGADVRISMTVGLAGQETGRLATVTDEESGEIECEVTIMERQGKIAADLSIGPDVAGTEGLRSNEGVCSMGFMLAGRGFVLIAEEASKLGLGRIDGLEKHIRPLRNGRDLTQRSRDLWVIDVFGLHIEEVRRRYPEVFQRLYDHVKPERDVNRDKGRRENWWLHGRTNVDLRNALAGLRRFIATPETARHRVFQFLDASILPEHKLVVIASEDAFHLGVLSSRIHVTWALASGARLGVGNDPVYVKSRCFETFPFPIPTDVQRERIRQLAEELDAHRKARLAAFPDLGMTDLYNVLENMRAAKALSEREEAIRRDGLVSILRSLHDDLDAAVAAAYGWPANLSDEAILARLVALNHERAAEEAAGVVRYLRPAYQNPEGTQQAELDIQSVPKKPAEAKAEKQPWPKALAAQAQMVQRILAAADRPATPADIAKRFQRAKLEQVAGIMETLEALGLVRRTADGAYVV